MADIGQTILYITQAITGAGLVWIALRRAPVDKEATKSGTLKNYAETTRIMGEENRQLQTEIDELRNRQDIYERKKYRVTVEFTIGDPPEPGKVVIEPLVDNGTIEERPMKTKAPFFNKDT
jgi:hypothetical protein